MRFLSVPVLCGVVALAASAQDVPQERPPRTATSEAARLGAEYLVQKAGTAWVYQLQGGSRGRISIDRFTDWKGYVSYSLGKTSGSAVWRVRDGAWVEHNTARGPGELTVLPKLLTVGTHWTAPPSVERGGKGLSHFEVVALDATVAVARGHEVDECLVVLESSDDGRPPFTHYYKPNMGKVAVRGSESWVALLSEFRPGGHGHQE